MSVLAGVRGRVTFAVLAVTAVAYSLLGTIGFIQIATSTRESMEERIEEVLDEVETGLSSGLTATEASTPDGVFVQVVLAGDEEIDRPGQVVITRTVSLGSTDLVLVGTTSEARLTDSLRSLYRALWIGIPIAAVISALLAGAATRRALRPVDAITRNAGAIGERPDGARVPVPDTGDEIERLATTVNEMLDRIDSGHAAQRRFTSDAAHELRTPLMALQGELELVGGQPDRVDETLLDRIEQLADRLGDRIDDLVLLATLDEARAPERATIDLRELVAAECRTIAPDSVVTGSAVDAEVDPSLVARAVRNVVANARRHAVSRVEATVTTDGGVAVVHVDDDGPGVPAHLRAQMFERFARLDESRSTDRGGSGLGLAIAASVAHTHGGSIRADDSPLGGLRVSLRFPVRA